MIPPGTLPSFRTKYLITEVKHPIHTDLYRIMALEDFGNVKRSDFGGFVRSYNNLDVKNSAWIYDDSIISGNARVLDGATVKNGSHIRDEVYIYGQASILSSSIKGCSRVFDRAVVIDSVILQNVWVHGDATIKNSILTDDVAVYGKMKIDGMKIKGYQRLYL